MSEYPQTTRMFIEPESLNQVYRQRRDRKLKFAEYEEEKQREERIEAAKKERKQREEERIEQAKARRAKQRAEIARAYNRMFHPELLAETPAGTTETQRKKLFSEIPCIKGDRVVLDRVIDSDADAIRDLKENPNVQRYLPAFLFENQRDNVHETIALLYGDLFTSKDSLILAVRIKESGELAGLIELYGLRDSLHKISLGCRLREQFWGQGVATDAVTLMVGYLYGETDIEIITASSMVENIGSARALEKSDFIRTARGVEEDWGFPEPTIVDKWFC
jgi:ribosomal-protein-alanine N-acetyltransferase